MRRHLIGFVALVIILGAAPVTHAQAVDQALYLVCTVGADDGISSLTQVILDPDSGRGNLERIAVLDYNHVDVLASTPDGKRLYFIDNGPLGTDLLAYYDLELETVIEVGPVTFSDGAPVSIDQAAFSPGGLLYIGNNATDSLYTVDLNTAVATVEGLVQESSTLTTVDLVGGDIIFAADGTAYLFVNNARSGAPAGLYVFDPIPVGGVLSATYLGTGSDGDHHFTGAAMTGNGTGYIIGSNREDEFHVQSRFDGSDVAIYAMYIDGEPYPGHNFGDMSNGPLFECNRTIGYWKNHAWSVGSVSICGFEVSEAEGSTVLWNANSENFSMLFAQMIAAKLNCSDCLGIPVIDEAEAWACAQGAAPDRWAEWADDQQKTDGTAHKTALDVFNNSNHCDDSGGGDPGRGGEIFSNGFEGGHVGGW